MYMWFVRLVSCSELIKYKHMVAGSRRAVQKGEMVRIYDLEPRYRYVAILVLSSRAYLSGGFRTCTQRVLSDLRSTTGKLM